MGKVEGGNPRKGVVWPKWAQNLVQTNKEITGVELEIDAKPVPKESGGVGMTYGEHVRVGTG